MDGVGHKMPSSLSYYIDVCLDPLCPKSAILSYYDTVKTCGAVTFVCHFSALYFKIYMTETALIVRFFHILLTIIFPEQILTL